MLIEHRQGGTEAPERQARSTAGVLVGAAAVHVGHGGVQRSARLGTQVQGAGSPVTTGLTQKGAPVADTMCHDQLRDGASAAKGV